MSKFKISEFHLKSDNNKDNELNVVSEKESQDTKLVIKSFEYAQIKREGDGDYSHIKSKYGSLAATDSERDLKAIKDRRFLINPLVRDPLAIEQEEKRVIEEKVRQGVAQLAEAEKKSSFAIGYEEGLSQGYEDAFKKIREENFEKIKQFNQLVNEIDNAKIEIFRANERFLIELIFRIARFVLLKELAVDKEFLLRLAVELVEKVGARDFITLKINQEDAEALDLLKSGLEKAYGKLSAQVKKGGCQIETEWNVIGTHIDTQLAGIYEGIMGSRRGAAS